MDKEKLLYDTPFYTYEGITGAARDFARALQKYFDIMLTDVRYNSDFGKECEGMYNIIDQKDRDFFVIKNTRPEQWAYIPNTDKPIFGYHVFEGDRLISQHAMAIDLSPINALMVPSTYNKVACELAGVKKPIEVIPHIIKPEFVPGLRPENEKFRFYCSGAIYGLSSKDRKGLDVMLEAWRPHVENPNMELVLKVNTKYADAMYQSQGKKFVLSEYLEKVYNGKLPENITVIQKNLTRKELVELYQSVDCVVLPSRSEGFGLIPFEALACGKPVIVTEGIGCDEYLKEINGGFLPLKTTGLALPEKRFPYYNGVEYTMWYEPDTENLKELMVDMMKNYTSYLDEAYKASEVIHEKFSAEAIGKKLYETMKKYE